MLLLTRLPSNLRPTTGKRVHLVTCGDFQSRDKDGGHTIRSAVAENPALHTTFMALCFIESELLLKFYVAGIATLGLSCSCDLALDPMTFIDKPDPYSLEIYMQI